MTTVFHRQFLIWAIFFSTTNLLVGRTTSGSDTILKTVSFTDLKDTVIKNEIAFFTEKGVSLKNRNTISKTPLTEIPIHNCTDNQVYLSIWSTYIHIYFNGTAPNKTADSIFLVTHSHFWVRIPKSTVNGIQVSNSCNFSGNPKVDDFFSPFFKAFYSADKKRLYIYLLGGTETNKYEVTWVIIDNKYYTRIVDSIP